jgi:hypothetical protein
VTEQQQQAARLLGMGRSRNDTAKEIGVNPSSISRWQHDEEFRDAVVRAKMATAADHGRVMAVLTGALSASKPDGSPDWRTRVAAAREIRAWMGVKDPPADDNNPEWEVVGADDEG